MATLSPVPVWQICDSVGAPIDGALLYTYEAGTSTPKATYSDVTGDVANTNPIVADGAGRLQIWLGTGAYKFILTDGNGAVLFDPDSIEGTTIWTVDNISASGGGAGSGSFQVVENIAALRALDESDEFSLVSVLGYYEQGDGGGGFFYWDNSSSETDDSGITITPTSTTGDGRWKRIIGKEINPRFYGALGDGTTNDSPAFSSTNTFCATGDHIIVVDAGTYLLSTDPALTVPIKTLPNAVLKWTAAINPALDIVIDPSDNTQHFNDGGNAPVLPYGYTIKPQWWGAVGDGTTDDTTAFQRASAAVPKGGTLYIPGVNTNYQVGDDAGYVITLKSNMAIRGDGDTSLLKIINSTNSTYAIIGHAVGYSITDVKIEKIAIDGNLANNTSGVGILINSLAGYIRDCYIYDCFNKGIDSYSEYFDIKDNILIDNSIYVESADRLTISGNRITATDDGVHSTDGINIYPAYGKDIKDTVVKNNTLVGCPIRCTQVQESTFVTSLTIAENKVDLSRTDLGSYGGHSCINVIDVGDGDIEIVRNKLYTHEANTGGGMWLGSGSGFDYGAMFKISDNIILLNGVNKGSSHNGINLANLSNVSISGNVIISSASSADYGIKEAGTCTNILYGINRILNFDRTIYPSVSIKINERLALTDSGTISGNANLVLGKGNINKINTTAATVNLIDSAGWVSGSIAILEFTGVITIKHNYTASANYKSVIFKSGVDFVSAATTTLIIKYDGTSWYEICTVLPGLVISEAANGRMGLATFTAETTKTVNNTSVTANTRIFLTIQSLSGGGADYFISEVTPGVSFVINAGGSITGTIAYLLIEPA